MNKFTHFISIFLLLLTAIILIALQIKLLGWLLLGCGSLITHLLCSKQFRKDIILIYGCIALLGITPISTDIGFAHFTIMGMFLLLAIVLPYVIYRYMYKENVIHFKLHHGRNWYKKEIIYIILTAFVTYGIFPFMLRETGSYLNWTVKSDINYLIQFFMGTNLLGIWDELFFINTVLVIFRRHLIFPLANLAQSVFFTSFLYKLGFRGWAFLTIFLFALLQGYIFKKTDSLFYLITIHLVVDFVLYLALIHAYHSSLVPIFWIK